MAEKLRKVPEIVDNFSPFVEAHKICPIYKGEPFLRLSLDFLTGGDFCVIISCKSCALPPQDKLSGNRKNKSENTYNW